MRKKHFSIIFCGGCNPKINRKRISETLSIQLAKYGYEVSYDSLDADFVVYLSGCAVGCAEQKKIANVPFTVVAGSSVDSVSYEENVLAAEIITRGRKQFEKL